MDYLAGKKERRTWRFKANNVHDFAWAADPDYTRIQTFGPDSLELNFYFLSKYKKTWRQLPAATGQFFSLMNEQFGRYPYAQFSVIQGGDGGMEYPMCTMLKGTGKLKGLIGVMAHESAHSWFYGMLATNENQYPWMDEGFTSFAEDEVLNKMSDNPVANAHLSAYSTYLFMVEKDEVVPMTTPSDYFSRNRSYGISSYYRGALFLNQLRYIIGEKDFNAGMKSYYRKWRFKHPEPHDFLRVMEVQSGLQLDWYLNFWVNTTKEIDYAIQGVSSRVPQALWCNCSAWVKCLCLWR
ncbi:MAG: M1 family aminopeptidase [Owenweeksia sp.]|nr:M1 family aminopeptidase [Owenweeksia sp.]